MDAMVMSAGSSSGNSSRSSNDSSQPRYQARRSPPTPSPPPPPPPPPNDELLAAIGDQFQRQQQQQQQQQHGHGHDEDDILEQHRIMAQVQANQRIRDLTGFDMAEYEEHRRAERRQQLQQQQSQQGRHQHHGTYFANYTRAIRPTLPEPSLMVQSWDSGSSAPTNAAVGGNRNNSSSLNSGSLFNSLNSSLNSSLIISGNSFNNGFSNNSLHNSNGLHSSGGSNPLLRPEEPTMPSRQANRRFMKHQRPMLVPDLCQGTVWRLRDGSLPSPPPPSPSPSPPAVTGGGGGNDGGGTGRAQTDGDGTAAATGTAATAAEVVVVVVVDPRDTVVTVCLGCRAYLRGHRLATLVTCPNCLAVSPIVPVIPPPEH